MQEPLLRRSRYDQSQESRDNSRAGFGCLCFLQIAEILKVSIYLGCQIQIRCCCCCFSTGSFKPWYHLTGRTSYIWRLNECCWQCPRLHLERAVSDIFRPFKSFITLRPFKCSKCFECFESFRYCVITCQYVRALGCDSTKVANIHVMERTLADW